MVRSLLGMATGCGAVLAGWLLATHPGRVAAAAVLAAALLAGVYVLMGSLGRLVRPADHRRGAQMAVEARALPAIRSHPEGSGVPRAISSAPRVVRGVVLERGKVEQ